MAENHEVYFEAGHIDEDGEDNETCYTCTPMFSLVSLREDYEQRCRNWCSETEPTHDILRSPNLSQRSSMVYRPTRAVTNSPTSLTLIKYMI
jgi:hypothetical protein